VIRRIFTILTIVSLLLCVCITTVWILSYFRDLHSGIKTSQVTFSTRASHGRFVIIWSAWQSLAPDEKPPTEPRFFGAIDWTTIGIHAVYVPRIKDPSHFKGANAVLTFPCWIAAMIAALLPIIQLILGKRKITRPNHCPICDYDLRVTPDRCPECGAIR
jgi:hypothetical protein